tara:strand:- start:583 stop:888 length:306 start_codon:yes stop_codon:yes gene_type:complete
MEVFELIERFGLPVMMVVALGFYAKQQTNWIQNELQKELRESFERLEGIVIKLIDAQKQSLMETKEIKASYHAVVEILASLSGNGLKEKFVTRKRKHNDNY